MSANTFHILEKLVSAVKCKPGWKFRLANDDDGEQRLVITVHGTDARYPEDKKVTHSITVSHYLPIPTTTYNERTWLRWIFEQCRKIENHELGEFFMIGEERPFAPLHAPGEDPYIIHEFRDEVDARTTQNGSITPRA
jgi:hypothetical protein